jgi:hypothetical protein
MMDFNPEFIEIARYVYSPVDIGDAEHWKKVVSERLYWYIEHIGMFPDIEAIFEEIPELAAKLLHYQRVEAPPEPHLAEEQYLAKLVA